MKTDYEIGDRVIAKVSWARDPNDREIKGIIHNIIIGKSNVVRRMGSEVFEVKYDRVIIGKPQEGLHTNMTLELDIQYYREERLKQLLDKR